MSIHNEDGISPVIGVILMVAITMILAAVIAAFVFGMTTTTMSAGPYAGVTARQVGTDIIVTYASSPSNGETITNMTVRLEGIVEAFMESPSIGDTITLDGKGTAAADHVTVVATFSGGRQSMILDTNV